MRLSIIAVASFALITAPQMAAAAGGPNFKLDKISVQCNAVNSSHVDYGNCIYAASQMLLSKMPKGVICSDDTCLVELPCVMIKHENKCQGGGFKIQYSSTDYGDAIEITLASGKVAHYSQCGTCSEMEPDTKKEIDLRLMGTEKVNILEFPASER